MAWVGPLVAVLVAVGAGFAATPLLRTLPEPTDDPDVATKLPYRDLATPGFAVAVGATTGVACGLVVGLAPASHWLAWAALSVVGVFAVLVDARTTWLPLPLARAGWAVAALGVLVAAIWRQDPAPLWGAAVGAGALWLFFEVFWRLTGGIGYGDVRLMATVGAVTGAHDLRLVLPAAVAGTVLGALWGIVHRLRRGSGPFPYGPALLAGPFVALTVAALTR